MASTDGPEAEFNDSRRKELLRALKGALLADTLQPTAWACLWLSDIDRLEYIVNLAQETPIFANSALDAEHLVRIVPAWTQRKRPSSAASTSQNPSTPPLQPPPGQSSCGQKRTSSGQLVVRRSQTQADQCRQRDQRKCILTNADEPEVTHIYPFSMRYQESAIRERTAFFWYSLRMFWSKERIDTWYDAIFSNPARTEVCQNLLCLSPNAHTYWQKAKFALKPIRISDDKKRLDVQFFWLSSNLCVPEINILQAPSLSAPDSGPNSARLYNHNTDTSIKSGDEISLETDNPILRPLPDFRLLEMQWFLHRVTAISGAAEPQDDSYDEDSDNNIDIIQAWHDRLDMYTEDDWDIEAEEVSTTEHFEEGRSLAEHFEDGRSLTEHFVEGRTLALPLGLRGGGGHREREDHGRGDYEGEGSEGEGHKGEGSDGEE